MDKLVRTATAGLMTLLSVYGTLAQSTVRIDSFPQPLQLYQRDPANLARVAVTGSAPVRYRQMSLTVLRNATLYFYQKQTLAVASTGAPFAFSPNLRAEAVEYDFLLYAHTSPTDSVLVSRRERILCGDVLILYGQSNVLALHDMENYPVDDRLLRNFTYPYLSTDIPNQVSWSTAKQPFGTVGGIGLWLQKLILDTYGIPTAVINGGVGGTPISGLSARDPGDHASLATYYGQLLYRARRAEAADKARIIVYKQGEADAAFNTGNYNEALRTLTDQFEEDYPAVKKIYISQINIIADPQPQGGVVREAQRRAGRQKPLIETIATVGTAYYDGVHYTRPGNQQIASELFRQIARDFYGSTDTLQINSPNIQTARYNARRDTITLTFDEQMRMVWPQDSTLYSYGSGTQYTRRMEDFIYLDGQAGAVVDGFARRNQIILALRAPSVAQTITYLPAFYSDTNSPFYDGVHLKNERGMRAFSFDKFPLTTVETPKLTQTVSLTTEAARPYSTLPTTLLGRSTSGLPVTVQVVSGPAVLINSHQIRLTGTGVITVKATQSGDTIYLPAADVVQSITVSKGTQQIGDLRQTSRSGQLTVGILATASSGLPVSYALLSGPASLNGTTLTLTDYGQATLQLTQAGDDHYFPAAPVTRTLCLNPEKPTISADPASGQVLVSSSAFRNQWLRNGDTLRAETKPQLTVTQQGSYAVLVTNPVAGCKSVEKSDAREVIVLAIEPVHSAALLQVYPNPATDQVRVRLMATSTQLPQLQLVDASGRLVADQPLFNSVADGYEATFSVRSLSSGVYTLRTLTDSGPLVSRLLIRP